MAHSRAAAVLFCTVLQVCFGTVYAWSFFQTLLVRQLGWSFTDTALAFSIAIFSLGLSAAGAGALLPRAGPRRLALTGSLMFSGGYLIAGLALHVDSLVLFCLGYGVIGGAGIGLGYVTPVATVMKWFPDRKGLATGIVIMGFGVGAVVLSKGLAPFLVVRTEGDLPLLFVWLGVIFACVLIPCSLMLRNPPSKFSTSFPGSQGSKDPQRGRLRLALCPVAGIRRHVACLLLQHRRGDLRHQLSIAAAAGRVGACGPVSGAENAGRVRGNADRRQLALQRRRAAVLGIVVRSHRPHPRVQDIARQPDDRVRHSHDRTRPLGFLRARLLYLAVLRWRLRNDAVLRPRRLRGEEDVGCLRGDPDGLGGGGDLRPPLCRVSEGPISRPGDHLMLLDRRSDPRPRIRVLLPVERRAHPPAAANAGRHAAPVWHSATPAPLTRAARVTSIPSRRRCGRRRPEPDIISTPCWRERESETLIARAEGRIDSTNARDFEDAMTAVIEASDRAVIIDGANLAYISSAGLRSLLLIGKDLWNRDAKLAICSLSASIREVFEISGFDKIISIHGSPAEALKSLAG